MTEPLVVTALVEGHGEVEALPLLLRRILEVVAPEVWVDVRRPLRVNRGTMLKKGEFERYVELAVRQNGGEGMTWSCSTQTMTVRRSWGGSCAIAPRHIVPGFR
jgi:hypothetical protein